LIAELNILCIYVCVCVCVCVRVLIQATCIWSLEMAIKLLYFGMARSAH